MYGAVGLVAVAAVGLAAFIWIGASNEEAEVSRTPTPNASFDATGDYSGIGFMPLESMRLGTCFNTDSDDAEAIMEVVPCAEPHGFEVISTPLMAAEHYGQSVGEFSWDDLCQMQGEPMNGPSWFDPSRHRILMIPPSEDEWDAGEHGIHCVVTPLRGERFTERTWVDPFAPPNRSP